MASCFTLCFNMPSFWPLLRYFGSRQTTRSIFRELRSHIGDLWGPTHYGSLKGGHLLLHFVHILTRWYCCTLQGLWVCPLFFVLRWASYFAVLVRTYVFGVIFCSNNLSVSSDHEQPAVSPYRQSPTPPSGKGVRRRHFYTSTDAVKAKALMDMP